MKNKKRKSFIQWLLAIFAIVFLGVVGAINGIGLVFAATTLETSISGLSASYDNGTWSINDKVITGSVSTTSSTSCGSTSYSASTGTLTLTNTATISATLKYTASVSSGGGSVSPSGENTIELSPNQSTTIKVTSKSDGADTTTATITIVSYKFASANFTTTFTTGANGSYTVYSSYTNSTISITSSTSLTQSTDYNYTLTATPNDGYSLRGWHIGSSFVQWTADQYEFCPTSNNITVYPVFGTGTYLVDSTYYYELNAAITAATSASNKKVIVADNSTVPSGEYTIPSNVALFIPFDNANTYVINSNLNDNYTGAARINYGTTVPKTEYRRLTLKSGATLNIQGALNVGGQFYTMSTGQSGYYGLVQTESGSTININNGANLYAFGYIKGAGSVNISSGGNVYEYMAIADYPGSATTTNNIINAGAFPFQKFSVQNVEIPMTIQSGGLEKIHMNVYGTSLGYHAFWINLFGNSTSYLFCSNSGSITKTFVSSRTVVDVNGNASINGLSVSLSGVSVSTSSTSGLPIPYNYTVNVNSGTTTINENVILSKGSRTTVANGATLSIPSNKNLYVLDASEDGQSSAGSVDALLDVNGTIQVNGSFYTSTSGANIISSSGTGKVQYSASAGTKTSIKWKVGSSASDVSIVSAKLHNMYGSTKYNPEYTETTGSVSGDKYVFCITEPYWYKQETTRYTISYNANGGSGSMATYTPSDLGHYTYSAPSNSFTPPSGKVFSNWNTQSDGTGTSYDVGDSIHVTASITLYAIWEELSGYTITWKNWNGSVLETDTEVPYGATPSYDGSTPTRPADAQYTYTFSGWTPTVVSVTDNATYTATFSTTVRTYTITWKSQDGTDTLKVDTNVPYGSTPAYTGETPTKAPDAQYTYVFVGWATSTNQTSGTTLPSVTGDATYYAAFSSNTNTYTITWKSQDGTQTLKTDSNVPYGSAPNYTGETPTKSATVQYTYLFAGWATSTNQTSGTTLPSVTGDATYYAAFTPQIRSYVVTFNNYDGTELYSSSFEYGSTPTYSGATPTREGNAQFSYTFSGWSPAISTVTGDATYTATYTSTVNTYTVTWQNWDGTILETDSNIAYGTMPIYGGATPTREGNAEFSYTFSGWSPEVSTVTGNATYTATFTQTTNTFTVTWKNGETVLETDTNVPYGSHPSFNGEEPTKETSGRHHYRFIGWSTDPNDTMGANEMYLTVTENTEYYAIFQDYVIGLYRDNDGYVRLYDEEGNFRNDVSGIFYYDSSIYTEDGDNNYYYLVYGVVQEGYGLVALQENSTTYLFYVLEDGTLLKETGGCTFYVSKTNGYTVNGITVQSGLYYFDANGHMYFGNSLLTGNTEFGVVSSGTATIGGGH